MQHAEPEPPRRPLNTSGTNDEESGAPDFFPPVGNFNAVVPLSEIDADSEVKIDSESRVTAPAPSPTVESPSARAAAEEREQDEHEEATLVPARAARTSTPLRPATRRPSWPVMIAALALSLMAGLAAGVYLIKSAKPVEIQAPASMTEDATHDAAAAAETGGPQPTQVASESRPEARPQAETSEVRPQTESGLDAVASAVDDGVRDEKTNRDLPAPKRVTADEVSSGRAERAPDASRAKASVGERTPEPPARRATPLKTDAPAPTEASRTRRATSVSERPPVLRAPQRSLPVSPPPPSTKSKKVIQWP